MKPEELNIIVRKVEELRALMVFTQRTIPFLEDVFAFVKDIVPLLDVLKSSVETTSEKLPHASKQLDKITTATELASTEIMNIVDAMYPKVDRMRAEQELRKTTIAAVRTALQRLCELTEGTPAEKEAHAICASVTAQMDALRPTDVAEQELESIQADCTNIMIALQVQDITAQQIAAVNKLMQSVDEGLNRLLKHFSKSSAEPQVGRYKHRRLDIVFDSSAEFDATGERQRAADAVIEEARKAPAARAPRARRKKTH
jgi:chemotaxis regulatin CheY-phosphate phosphatase CheZ